MTLTYDVRIWKLRPYAGAAGTTYGVRWKVAGKEWKDTFATRALADSYRSDLLTAARRGEAFDTRTGRPASWQRPDSTTWFEFAVSYAKGKWPTLAGNSRKNTARALAGVTLALITNERGKPATLELRTALSAWAFNVQHSKDNRPPDNIGYALQWLSQNTRPVADLVDPTLLRQVLDSLTYTQDGKPAAAATTLRKRGVLYNALEHAVERGLLTRNPVPALNWQMPRTAKAIDRRRVVNPKQAAALLGAVGQQPSSGPGLVAFFAAMYYSALRPAEAVNLKKANLSLPRKGWGELILDETAPEVGASWSDTGRRRDRRTLKHRASGDTRTVPCPPVLTELLHQHLERFGTGPDGRLFRNVRGGELAESTYSRIWRKAREHALTPEQVASPLAHRPYDLRHAAVSTWLNGGVPATQVAEWAGHSVAVLLQVYAKCLIGQEEIARDRIEAALRHE